MIARERIELRCRFCGLTIEEAHPDHVLVPCEWGEAHVFVHPDSPGYKRHPFTQFAATLYELARMCSECGALIREGEGTDGKVRWFTAATAREHWRECL